MIDLTRHKQFAKGATLIEFALTLPIAVLIIFGMFEFGSLLFNREQLSQLAYNTARKGSSDPSTTNATLDDYLDQQLAQRGLAVLSKSITPDLTNLPRGSEITVSITVTGAQLSWISAFPLNLSNQEFIVSSTMIKEY